MEERRVAVSMYAKAREMETQLVQMSLKSGGGGNNNRNGQRPGAFGRKLELLWIKCHQVTRCPIVFDVNQGQSHIVENLTFEQAYLAQANL